MPTDPTLVHDQLFARATGLAQRFIVVGAPLSLRRLGWLERWRLSRCLKLFDRVLELNPQNWAARWTQGKVLQRLGRHADALRRFEAAHQMNPAQSDVAREAGIEAGALGEARLAVKYCEVAASLRPTDAGLVSNLALAFLINGELDRAMATAGAATLMNPKDDVSASLRRLIEDVASGRRPLPKSTSEIA
jgi:Flp pilus assembly protein TadD